VPNGSNGVAAAVVVVFVVELKLFVGKGVEEKESPPNGSKGLLLLLEAVAGYKQRMRCRATMQRVLEQRDRWVS
jgi:hypothetical protein